MILVTLLFHTHMAFSPQVEQWRGALTLQAGSIPVDFALEWIAKESGGQLGGSQCGDQGAGFAENGLFQLSQEEAAQVGITGSDFDSLCSDGSWSIQAGLRLIQYHMANASSYLAQYGQNWQSPDYWKLVKLCHAGGTAFVQWALAAGGSTSWDALVQVTQNQSNPYYGSSKTAQIVANADDVGSYAPTPSLIGGLLTLAAGFGLAWYLS